MPVETLPNASEKVSASIWRSWTSEIKTLSPTFFSLGAKLLILCRIDGEAPGNSLCGNRCYVLYGKNAGPSHAPAQRWSLVS